MPRRDGDGAWQVLSPDVSAGAARHHDAGDERLLAQVRCQTPGETDPGAADVVKPREGRVDPLENGTGGRRRTEFAPRPRASGAGVAGLRRAVGDDLRSMPVSQLLRSLLAERRGAAPLARRPRRPRVRAVPSAPGDERGESSPFRSRGRSPRASARRAPRSGCRATTCCSVSRRCRPSATERRTPPPIPADGNGSPWRWSGASGWTIERGEGNLIEVNRAHYPLAVGTDRIGVSLVPGGEPSSESLSSFFCTEVAIASTGSSGFRARRQEGAHRTR